jgi:hypothetical protein
MMPLTNPTGETFSAMTPGRRRQWVFLFGRDSAMDRHQLEKALRRLEARIARQRADLVRMSARLEELTKLAAEARKDSHTVVRPNTDSSR